MAPFCCIHSSRNMSILQLLGSHVAAAMQAAGVENPQPAIQLSSKPQFGDYQANGIMGAAKTLRMPPRQLAEKVVPLLEQSLAGIVAKLEIAGPGFINITLDSAWLAAQLIAQQADARLGTGVAKAETVVVDYSSPNLAKEMHVGHLRSSIIGDALASLFESVGHKVVRQNHVGDWGTQFGMLIAYLVECEATQNELALNDLEGFYRAAKQRFDADAAFATTAREYVVKLQSGDADVLAQWQKFLDVSLHHCEAVYEMLGVKLTRADVRGESAYNDDLARVVADLKARGMLVESEGAQVVFLEEFKNPQGEAQAVIIQKQDGGFLYATTDLAALRYRSGELGADRVLYVVDARQGLHFQQMFTLAKKAGFVKDDMRLQHVAFGTMMGDDGKPFKTRSGGTVKLVELLEEAERRAFDLVSEKNPNLAEERRRRIARAVGVGAVKYADLSKNRISDYVFDWNQMLSFEGNTAPYLQYAYTRVASIFRQVGDFNAAAPVALNELAERDLALALLQYADTIEQALEDATPHSVCAYLYQIASRFSRFYDACPVLKAEAEVRASRLVLCAAAARVLRTGLELLGIEVLEEM